MTTAPLESRVVRNSDQPRGVKEGARSKGSRKRALLTVLGVVFLGLMLFPVYWMINASLQPTGNTLTAEWFPFTPSFAGYEKAITQQGANLLTSLMVSIGTVAFSLAIAAPAAYALAQFKFRWVGSALLIVLISQMIPGIVIANALYTAYEEIGLLNSIAGLIFANSSSAVPFAILVLYAFMGSIPPSIIEAARVDGASHLRTLVSIVVPISRNALITAGLFAFLFSWSDFLFALTLTTTPEVRPVTLGIYNYLGSQVANWSAVMATAVLSSLPAIVLLLLAQKYIAAGATGGAVK